MTKSLASESRLDDLRLLRLDDVGECFLLLLDLLPPLLFSSS